MKKIVFIFFLTVIGCSSEPKVSKPTDNDTVKTVCTDRLNRISWESAMIERKYLSSGRISFDYLDVSVPEEDKESNIATLRFLNSMDSISYLGIICYLRGFKDYAIKSHKYRICRYYLDTPEAIDEEGEVYINDSIGIIRTYSTSWGNTVTYIKDSITYKLNKELAIDTSTFVENEKNRILYYKELTDFMTTLKRKNNKR